MDELADSAYEEITSKLRAQKLKEPNEGIWPYYLARCEENQGQYDAAVEYYKESFAIDGDSYSAYAIASCYDELGKYREAAKYCELAIRINSTKSYYSTLLANIKDHAGQPNEAIEILDNVIAEDPANDFAYYRRGWIKDNIGDIDGALEDYSTAIDLDPDYYTHGYLHRGILWKMKGEHEKATQDFETVIRLDSIPEEADCSFYAYYYLGQREKAIEVLNATLEDGDNGDYYDAACLYSIMGEKEQALAYLHKSLEMGWDDFNHIRRDRDLDNIRDSKKFKTLLNAYDDTDYRQQEELTDTTAVITKTTEIPFTREYGDTYTVDCSINGLPLTFCFDTGCSSVSISKLETDFMMKHGYLKRTDFGGKLMYKVASGDIKEGTEVILRNVSFAGFTLNNVRASVVDNQEAPLLLGQSVLSRLGKIEIDNTRAVIKITSEENADNSNL